MINTNKKIVFILKEKVDYGGSTGKLGLLNSINLHANAFRHYFGIDPVVTTVIDGNGINKVVVENKADIVFLEAIWCPPYKLAELAALHPKKTWYIRVHSKTPFLANEGSALTYLAAYAQIPNVVIAFNNETTAKDFKTILPNCIYLPNMYHVDEPKGRKTDYHKEAKIIRVGCFGAIRPMKNHLNQAVAAINMAESRGLDCRFYVNAGRVEQGGQQVLKNLRALFEATNGRHQLVELDWLEPKYFRRIVRQMDVGMQVSMSESFNIVSADFAEKGIPMVVSNDIDWMHWLLRCDPNNAKSMEINLKFAYSFPRIVAWLGKRSLRKYTDHSVGVWADFLNQIL